MSEKAMSFADRYKMVCGAIAVTIILAGILVAAISASSDEETGQQAVLEDMQRVNYDAVARAKVQEAIDIRTVADTIIGNHPADYRDASIYNYVEDIYVEALAKLQEALADKDSLSESVVLEIASEQNSVFSALLGIWKDLESGAADVEEFKTRADAIKHHIEEYIKDKKDKR